MEEFLIEDVFGNSRDVPLSYTKRESVDDLFKDSLRRKKHIAIFGSSKQGKTCLRKTHIRDDEYIYIQCSNKQKIDDLNELILKSAGYKITFSEKKSNTGKLKANLTIGAKLLSIFETKADAGFEKEAKKEVEERSLEIDLGDVNDVINALKSISFSKFILLEDFHYLTKEVQSELTFTLKAYSDNSQYVFIIIGVWLEENRIIGLNGDMAGRIVSINADNWNYSDLANVIETGARLLNIKFDSTLIENIIEASYDNVFFVQEICYKICQEFKIKKSLPREIVSKKNTKNYIAENGVLSDQASEEDDGRYLVPNAFNIKEITTKIIDQHSGRFKTFIAKFNQGFTEDSFEIYKWILFVIIDNKENNLLEGVSLKKIKKSISEKHPLKETLKKQDIEIFLRQISDFQLDKKIIPNILDYSEASQLLQIVDKGFIIWLGLQSKEELLNQIEF